MSNLPPNIPAEDRPITPRQREVLYFIQREIKRFERPPTAREICEHFGWSSLRAAQDHIRALERKGYIKRLGGSRNIKLRHRR